MFVENDLKNAIPILAKSHPFLPDRHWLKENLNKKLAAIITQVNQGEWVFSSIQAYLEWQEKPIAAVKMSTPDWLVHFALLQKLEERLQPFFIPHTHYQLSKMDGLIAQCQQWKQANATGWIFKTDIKGFFSHINFEILQKQCSELIDSPILNALLKQYLTAIERAMNKLENHTFSADNFQKNSGLPIGAELNYLLASTYLLPVDKMLFEHKAVVHYARYVDDVLLFFLNDTDIIIVKNKLETELEKLELKLNIEKTTLQLNYLKVNFLRVSF